MIKKLFFFISIIIYSILSQIRNIIKLKYDYDK